MTRLPILIAMAKLVRRRLLMRPDPPVDLLDTLARLDAKCECHGSLNQDDIDALVEAIKAAHAWLSDHPLAGPN